MAFKTFSSKYMTGKQSTTSGECQQPKENSVGYKIGFCFCNQSLWYPCLNIASSDVVQELPLKFEVSTDPLNDTGNP